MALITCPECGQQISDRAKACPNCGVDMTAPKCPDYGTYLLEGAAACPNCGCPVEATASASTKIPVTAPAPRAAAKPGAAILELPGPHYRMKSAEEWVVTDDAGATVKAHIKWGDTQKVELPLTAAEPVRMVPEEQLNDQWKENFRHKIWPFHKVLMIICLIIAVIGLCAVIATVFSRVGYWQDSIGCVPREEVTLYYSYMTDYPVDKFLPADIGLALSFFAAVIALVLALLQLFMLLMHREQPNAETQPGKLRHFYNVLVRRFPTVLHPTASKHKTWVKILVSSLPVVVTIIAAIVCVDITESYQYDYLDIISLPMVNVDITVVVLGLCPFILYGIILALCYWHYGRRSKHLRLIVSPGKRYGLVWKNRHSFSVSEYNA